MTFSCRRGFGDLPGSRGIVGGRMMDCDLSFTTSLQSLLFDSLFLKTVPGK